jgi:hypothetical protein
MIEANPTCPKRATSTEVDPNRQSAISDCCDMGRALTRQDRQRGYLVSTAISAVSETPLKVIHPRGRLRFAATLLVNSSAGRTTRSANDLRRPSIPA